MTRYITLTIVLMAILLLPGCKLFGAKPETQIVDTFCLTAKKQLWSVNDRPERIREARIANQVIDRRCGYPGQAA